MAEGEEETEEGEVEKEEGGPEQMEGHGEVEVRAEEGNVGTRTLLPHNPPLLQSFPVALPPAQATAISIATTMGGLPLMGGPPLVTTMGKPVA